MTGNSQNSNNQKKQDFPQKEEEKPKSKLSDTLQTFKKSEQVDHILEYAKSNTQDTIAYALLVLGIIWGFFDELYGGILVGLVAGFYFSRETIHLFKSYHEVIEEQGVARSIVLAGTLLALFFASPGIFIGIAIMTGLKIILRAE